MDTAHLLDRGTNSRKKVQNKIIFIRNILTKLYRNSQETSVTELSRKNLLITMLHLVKISTYNKIIN